MLRSLFLHEYNDSARHVRNANGRFCLVDVLSAGTLRAHGVDLEIGLVDMDVNILHLWEHCDSCRRGMDATRSLSIGYALDAMRPWLEFKLGKHATPAHLGDDFLEAAFRAFAQRKNFRLPTLLRCIAFVHAEKISGEQRGFVAAGTRADFENRVVIVHRIFRQQSETDLLRQGFLPSPQFVSLVVAKLSLLLVGAGIIDQRGKLSDFLIGAAIGFDRFDDWGEFGEFTRQFDVSVRSQSAGELAFHQCMAGKQSLHLLLGQDRQSCNPSAAAKVSSLWRMETLPTGCSRHDRRISSPFRQSRSSRSAFTGPTADGERDNVRYPRMVSAKAPIGCEASSPQSVTGLPCFFALSAMSFSARKTGAESGSNRSDTR